jgi:murein L,D-transpeptidase YcbB/YkuD
LLIELELRATDAFLMLASHLVAGRTNPESLRSEWVAIRRDANPVRRLQEAIETGNVTATLARLSPAYTGYDRLLEARKVYQDIASSGGWPTVSDGEKLERDMAGDRVGMLRRRLVATGDLAQAFAAGEAFDGPVEEAVLRFQRRHGLDADGVVGPATLAALNVSASDRVRMIDVNLERWRWLPQDLGRRYILVNIANFEMDLIEDGKVTLNMRAVVGRPYRRTPVFSDTMTYLVLNPRWNVPRNIATQDILPKLRADPNYMANQNMKLFQGSGAEQRELSQQDVDWNQVTAREFRYYLRQEPGPYNALGRVKFMFPNAFDVYLHDSPARELFGRTERTFSSGCIRLERALDLAEHLLSQDQDWTRQQLDAALATGREQSITLRNPISVHILYWTAWVEEDGSVQFRNDIYNRDAPVREALVEPPPRVGSV